MQKMTVVNSIFDRGQFLCLTSPMDKPVQQRTLKTRARLVEAARQLVAEGGYDTLRTEQIVARAQVAKGTFFAHFRDKDALLDLLIGTDLSDQLDQMAAQDPPHSIPQLVAALLPLTALMTQSRTVFDVILRHSGAARIDTLGPIAQSFDKQITLFCRWFDPAGPHPFRRDIDPQVLAEGVQAFLTQAMALNFCARNSQVTVEDRLMIYLQAWLTPAQDPLTPLS